MNSFDKVPVLLRKHHREVITPPFFHEARVVLAVFVKLSFKVGHFGLKDNVVVV